MQLGRGNESSFKFKDSTLCQQSRETDHQISKARITQCDLSAVIPFKLVDSHLITMKFSDGIAWVKRISQTWAVRQIAMCNPRLECNYLCHWKYKLS